MIPYFITILLSETPEIGEHHSNPTASSPTASEGLPHQPPMPVIHSVTNLETIEQIISQPLFLETTVEGTYYN